MSDHIVKDRGSMRVARESEYPCWFSILICLMMVGGTVALWIAPVWPWLFETAEQYRQEIGGFVGDCVYGIFWFTGAMQVAGKWILTICGLPLIASILIATDWPWSRKKAGGNDAKSDPGSTR